DSLDEGLKQADKLAGRGLLGQVVTGIENDQQTNPGNQQAEHHAQAIESKTQVHPQQRQPLLVIKQGVTGKDDRQVIEQNPKREQGCYGGRESAQGAAVARSEEHTSELQSREN